MGEVLDQHESLEVRMGAVALLAVLKEDLFQSGVLKEVLFLEGLEGVLFPQSEDPKEEGPFHWSEVPMVEALYQH